MNTKALWSVAVLGTVTAFFSDCGDGDSTKIKICNATQVTCLDDRGGEICSADGTRALPFQCGDGQRCCDPKKEDDCQDASGDDIKKTSCVGDCTPGATECGSKAVSLVCNTDGKGWSSIACPAGTGCDEKAGDTFGTCVRSDENIVVCEGGETVCADNGTLKTCEEDGSNWVYSSCAANEDCTEGECKLNPDKGCEPHSGTCVDRTHVKMCANDGLSYEEDLVECPDGTTCDQGACQGPVCTVGAIRCDDVRTGNSTVNALAAGTFRAQALYHCNADGTGWDITSCTDSEICVYDNISNNTVNDYVEALKTAQSLGGTAEYPALLVPSSAKASCQEPKCAAPFALRELFGSSLFSPDLTAGSFMCGDGNDPEDDEPLASFSLCEGLPPFNNLHWANYHCEEPEVCTYRGAPTSSEEIGFVVGPSCSASCVSGTKACFSESSLASGSLGGVSITGEATIECVDGVYDPSTVDKCWTGTDKGRELWCGPNLHDSDADIGTCMEPVCAAWFNVFDTFSIPDDIGACGTDGKFYPCKTDGTFGTARECSECKLADTSDLPQITGLAETFAGYDPGQCMTCTNGEAECLFEEDNTTPYFRECVKGKWRTDACDDSLCTTYVDPGSGLYATACGAECKPFTKSCGGVDGKQIRTCSDKGVLPDDFMDCGLGACHTDALSTVGYTASASCEVECIEDSVICAFVDTDDDGFTEDSEITCNGKGRYESADAVACDTSNPGAIETCVPKVGCAECDPGTFSGIPEVRCALDDDGLPLENPSVQVCNAGKWDDAIPCPGETPVCSLGVCTDLGGTGGQGGGGSN